MEIVILDGYTVNPGDLSWGSLEKLGRCTIYDRTPHEEIVPRAQGAEIVLTNKTPLDGESISLLPALRYIGVMATGYNIIDTEASSRRGIVVTNVPDYGTMSVAQLVFAHLFNLTHHLDHHTSEVRRGRWCSSADFCFWDYPLVEVSGLVIGIVGMGRIGSAVARIASALEMGLLAHDPSAAARVQGVRFVELDELFSRSDVVSLHCPLKRETEGLVGRARLAMMKATSYLINTSRGGLVDADALASALNEGKIAGAGLDVLSLEPPPPENPLLAAKNCSITPHIAWATAAARARMIGHVTENVRAFLGGAPTNVVNASKPSSVRPGS